MACGIPKTFQVMAESHLGLHTSLRVTETSWDSPKHREKLPVTPRGVVKSIPDFGGFLRGENPGGFSNLRRFLTPPPKKTYS